MLADTGRRNYNAIAWLYEFTTRIYSLGRIGASKAWQTQYVNPGDRVLYAGVGTGEDAVLAAQRGALVTCVDVAPKMLKRAQARIEAEGLAAEFICIDIAKFDAPEPFDVVVANFFFNIFDDDTTVYLVDHLAGLLRPGGRFMIADFMPARGRGFGRFLQLLHNFVANATYWLIGLAHFGLAREYPEYLESAGFEIRMIEEFPLTRWGPRAFWSIVAKCNRG